MVKSARPSRGQNESELIINPPNALRALRVKRDVSASVVASATSLHKEAVIRLEVHGTGVGKAGRKRLAEFYGVNEWDLNNLDFARALASELNNFSPEKTQKNLPESVTNY